MKQYAASPVIQALVADWTSYFPNSWQDEFYNVVWNIETAQGFGLDIWGRIVVIGRNIKVPATNYFGFHVTNPQTWSSFGQDSFYTGPASTATVTLTDSAYQVLILAKAYSNIASTDSRSINQFLQKLFPGRGRAWVSDLGKMTMRIVFQFPLASWELAVLTNGGVLPRPAGVGATIAQIPLNTFGFAEAGSGSQPFNQAPFLSNGAVTNAN